MRLVFIGAPGAGKGSVAKILEKRVGFKHISTGDLFRYHIANNTPLGVQIEETLAKGELVEDKVTFEVLKEALNGDLGSGDFVLDGFPRDLVQLKLLCLIKTVDFVVNFSVDEETLIRRLSGRRVAPSTGRIYHLEYNPPITPGIDDETGETLIQRDDDTEEAILRRFDIYKKLTFPIIEQYKNMGLLVNIEEENMSIEQVAEKVIETLDIRC